MKRNFNDKATMKKRIVIGTTIVVVVCLLLMLRVSYITIFKHEEYSKMAIDQWTSDVKISAKRGKILDRHGKEMAVSGNVYRVDIDLKTVAKYNKDNNTTNEELSKSLANVLEMEEDKVLKKLNYRLPSGAPAQSSILVRRIEKEKADKVKDLDIDGIMVSADTMRYYPNSEVLSHVLGTTNSDGKGLTGIELIYDGLLAGKPGLRITEIAKDGADITDTISRFTPPVDGKDVTLTIDLEIQKIIEKAANIAVEKNQATAVSIIAMDPRNGEVLGMVNSPNYDLNKPYEGFEDFKGDTDSDKIQKMWRNRAVSDTFEPGSIFKVITATAAMEENLVVDGEIFKCGGSTKIADKTIHCWKRTGHGDLTFEGIVQNSCNVGFMELGQRLGAERLTEYIKKYGLGKKSGVDLPGEAAGIIKKPEKITDTDLATISFGQTNTVSMIQFMTAFNAIANGGTLMQPHVMKDVSYTAENGERIITQEFEANKVENIISKETATEFRKILESVVLEGGAKNSRIEGFQIGGKTGTAQKVNENGGYKGGGYIASFISMVPTDEPVLTLFISIDNPTGGAYYGGVIATPVAKMVYEDIFNYLKPSYFNAEELQEYDIIIPEVRGLTVNEAKKLLTDSGLKYEIEGEDEYISDMLPKAGYMVADTTKIKLYTGGSSNYNKDVIIPDFIGYSKEMVESLMIKIGLVPKFEGEGTVKEQSHKKDDVVKKGETITFIMTHD
ncbi:MAG: stage V sporulation protein D [Sarcina sp.]